MTDGLMLCKFCLLWLAIGVAAPPSLAVGHWRCWQDMKRMGTFFNEFVSLDHKHWLDTRTRLLRYGLPISDVCCHPSFGPQGNVRCWSGAFSYKTCCTSPVLPERCAGNKAFAWVAPRGQAGPFARQNRVVIDVGASKEAKARRHGELENCATLDEIAVYFSDPILGAGDKHAEVHDYLQYYEPLLAPWGFNASVLEIGVAYGHSLAMWSMWFPDGSVLGVDINLSLFNFHEWSMRSRGANISRNSRVLEWDATQPSFLQALRSSTFDLIIDDASHRSEDQIATFELLFPTRLRDGGWYMVEDVDHILSPNSSFDYFADVARSAWLNTANVFSSAEQVRRLRQLHADDWRYQVDLVTFRHNLIMVRKAVILPIP